LCNEAPVKSSSPTNQHPVFYRPDALSVAQQQCQSTEGKNITSHGLAYPKLTWEVFQLCLWLLMAPGYRGAQCSLVVNNHAVASQIIWQLTAENIKQLLTSCNIQWKYIKCDLFCNMTKISAACRSLHLSQKELGMSLQYKN